MIRSIKHYNFTIPTGTRQDVTVPISSVNPDRCIVNFQGAGYKQCGPTDAPYAALNLPYLASMETSSLIVNYPFENTEEAVCGVSVIEYI